MNNVDIFKSCWWTWANKKWKFYELKIVSCSPLLLKEQNLKGVPKICFAWTIDQKSLSQRF